MRELTLNSLGANNGINANAFGVLHVEGCVINGFSFAGVLINLAASGSRVYIKDTIIRNCGNYGLLAETSTGTLAVTVDHCRAENNGIGGIAAFNGAQMTVRDSLASGNIYGFVTTSNSTAQMSIENCVATNNANTGVLVSSGTTIRLSSTMVTENSTGILNSGTLESFGNNRVSGNGTNTSGNAFTNVGQQ